MKKLIFSALFLFVATFTFAQGTTNGVALEILKMSPEQYATKTQNELQQVCNLKPEQAEKIYAFALKTANNVHELEEVNAETPNAEHEEVMRRTLQYGESYIVNILDKNQVAAYSKKDRILRKAELIKEREAMAKKYNETKAAKRN